MSDGMPSFVRRGVVAAHLAGASALVLVALGGTAFGASGPTGPTGPSGPTGPTALTPPSLKIAVKPQRVAPKHRYVVTITGSFQAAQRPNGVYLVDFLQYIAAPCKQTAQAEYALPSVERTFDFAGAERRSPFKHSQAWIAGKRTGVRHACAYLYSQRTAPNSTAAPIARADKRYRVT